LKLHFKNVLFISFVFSFLTLSCAQIQEKTDLEKVFKKIPENEYQNLISKHTHGDKKYEGFYNTYDVSVTQINTFVQEALLQREGYFMQWENTKAQSEREKTIQKMSSTSEFFISLFTPKADHNDLHKGVSMWKVFLEVNGNRYAGKIQKFDKNLVQTQNLFPFHTRFHKGYIVSFNIPMSSVEKNKSVFILTSSLGNSTFIY
jgi:hypothetical protein